ncbi:short-chain dehydrogenase [Actinoplanes sp. NPDC049265]|uniref:short-chain dehydrogenase n=1 Tax=Actinoplanes sp. NPDC049265 TaxID=3363902 RepID=UPI00371E8E64
MPKIAVLGAGPGLGASVARRFLSEGYEAELVSRRGFTVDGARPHTADLSDPATVHEVITRIGAIDVLYFGPAIPVPIVPLPDATPHDVILPLTSILSPAVAAVREALTQGVRAVLLPTGLSGLRPMPMLGSLAPMSAALRMYALTLHESLLPRDVYIGTLTIGGLIARGDIHAMVAAQHEGPALPTLDPDTLADRAWHMVAARSPAEEVFATPLPTT